jgi:hypothetical protein
MTVQSKIRELNAYEIASVSGGQGSNTPPKPKPKLKPYVKGGCSMDADGKVKCKGEVGVKIGVKF